MNIFLDKLPELYKKQVRWHRHYASERS